jgi:16S rRNA G966 N2-methylase RsmD
VPDSDLTRLSSAWKSYYQVVRDDAWPDVTTEQDILDLPPHILRELLFGHAFLDNVQGDPLRSLSDIDTVLPRNQDYFSVRRALEFHEVFPTNGIDVYYHTDLDGGGTSFGRYYHRVIEQLYPGRIFTNCFEWCSGPGFIGFDLLSRDICRDLYLADIFHPAIESIQHTVMKNAHRCRDRVHVHHCARTQDLPEQWKFDLVVANPPHYNPNLGVMVTNVIPTDRRNVDLDWQIHREFFSNIGQHLNPGAVILLQECSTSSGPDMFRSMVEEHGLYINDCYWEPGNQSWYYLEVKCKI